MIGVLELWLPILLSAILIFVVSSILHMVLRYHWKDQDRLPEEDAICETIRKAGVPPGNYRFPYAATPAEMKSGAIQEKWSKGPVGYAHILPSGPPAFLKNLTMWFIYTVVIGIFVAYVAGRTLDQGTDYLTVFRIAGTAAFLGYAGGEPIAAIWKAQNTRTTLGHMFDGFIYAMLTAGTFGWLWPQ